MQKKSLVISLLLLLTPVLLLAQLREDTQVNMVKSLIQPSKIQTLVGVLGLNPNNFTMTHSYTLSVGSFGGQTYNQGLYLNTMRYQLSQPISMYLQVGLQHQPFQSQLLDNTQRNHLFVSGAGLQYKPYENFTMRFEFNQQQNSFLSPNYYNNYRSPLRHERSVFDNDSTGNN